MRFPPRVTYANVVATLALFIALGGAAWAAAKLPKNSVGTAQLKRSAVTTGKIRNEAVTGAKIRKGTIEGSRIDLSTLGAVPLATSATTATSAAKAELATKAETAETAGNTKALGGEGSDTYLGRVAQAAANGENLHISSSGVTEATPGSGPLAIEVPDGVEFVVVDGAASFADAASNVELWVQAEEPCAAQGFGYENQMYGTLASGSSRQELSQHLVFAVGAGIHTYRLCVRASPGVDVFSRTLSVMTVPKGASG